MNKNKVITIPIIDTYELEDCYKVKIRRIDWETGEIKTEFKTIPKIDLIDEKGLIVKTV